MDILSQSLYYLNLDYVEKINQGRNRRCKNWFQKDDRNNHVLTLSANPLSVAACLVFCSVMGVNLLLALVQKY